RDEQPKRSRGRGGRGGAAEHPNADAGAGDDAEGAADQRLADALDAAQDAANAVEPGDAIESGEDAEIAVTGLLIRALWLSQDKDDSGWLYSSAVKQQMRRMDPSFNEKALGFRSFSDFLKSRSDVAELEETGHERLVRLRDQSI
ncbi:OST-HTH/LOTUS domain-containing protein, partial [Leucobacter chromiiresistens]